jgi:hypothetical protein
VDLDGTGSTESFHHALKTKLNRHDAMTAKKNKTIINRRGAERN